MILLFVVLVGLATVVSFLPKPQRRSFSWAVEMRRPLTKVEQKLYWRLSSSMPDHVILAQVQLSRFIEPAVGPARRVLLNKLLSRSVDFLVCDKAFSIVAAVELDDSSHFRVDRQRADRDKDAALAAAGVRLVRWQARSLPDEVRIRSELLGSGV